MKTSAIVAFTLVVGAQGFAPASQGRAGSQLNESLFDKVFKMDLFEPVKDQNNYGARAKKNVGGQETQKNRFSICCLMKPIFSASFTLTVESR